jgi:RNA polymerase sigma-70 factor (ECF subfamily)
MFTHVLNTRIAPGRLCIGGGYAHRDLIDSQSGEDLHDPGGPLAPGGHGRAGESALMRAAATTAPDDDLGSEIRQLGSRTSGAGVAEFDALYRAQAPTLLRFLRARTQYSEDAADLLQETFTRFARLSLSRKLDNPAAYLQRIAANLLVDRARAPANRLAHVPLDDLELIDPAPSPLSQVETKEMVRRLEAALARLRPKTRQVYLLHRFEGLTYERIAAQLGLSASGVEKHMSKAIAHLDRRLSRR